MTRNQVAYLLTIIMTAYPNSYRNIDDDATHDTVNLWFDMLSAHDFTLACAGVKAMIAADTKGFPPCIGQVLEKNKLLEKQLSADRGRGLGQA